MTFHCYYLDGPAPSIEHNLRPFALHRCTYLYYVTCWVQGCRIQQEPKYFTRKALAVAYIRECQDFDEEVRLEQCPKLTRNNYRVVYYLQTKIPAKCSAKQLRRFTAYPKTVEQFMKLKDGASMWFESIRPMMNLNESEIVKFVLGLFSWILTCYVFESDKVLVRFSSHVCETCFESGIRRMPHSKTCFAQRPGGLRTSHGLGSGC